MSRFSGKIGIIIPSNNTWISDEFIEPYLTGKVHSQVKDEVVGPEKYSKFKYDFVANQIVSPTYNEHLSQLYGLAIDDTKMVYTRPNKPSIFFHGANTLPTVKGLFLLPPLNNKEVMVGPSISHTTARIALAANLNSISLDHEMKFAAYLRLQLLIHEISYASFVGYSSIIIAGPDPSRKSQLGQYILNLSRALSSTKIEVILRMKAYISESNPSSSTSNSNSQSQKSNGALTFNETHLFGTTTIDPNPESKPKSDFLDVWQMWNEIRTALNYPSNLSVMLEIPDKMIPEHVMDRWYAEPVSGFYLPSKAFAKNKNNNPVLPRKVASFLKRFLFRGIFTLLEYQQGDPNLPQYDTGPQSIVEYLRYMIKKSKEPDSHMKVFAHGYEDYMMTPIQPLTDNLLSATYEVFERDPIKYVKYKKAIFQGIREVMSSKLEKFPEYASSLSLDSTANQYFYILVVGAGRGPLVQAALEAAEEIRIKIKVYALERNPDAYVYLTRRNEKVWKNKVFLEHIDARHWKVPSGLENQFGIIVSELLGSFGDNELSPECLFNLQRTALDQEYGVMIPESYTSFITPAQSSKLYTQLYYKGKRSLFHTPYIVLLDSVSFLGYKPIGKPDPEDIEKATTQIPDSTEKYKDIHIETAWSFTHPDPALMVFERNLVPYVNSYSLKGQSKTQDSSSTRLYPLFENEDFILRANSLTERECDAEFKIPNRGTLHGIAGFFETKLATDIELSTRPDLQEIKSPNLTSWFSIWFPLETPMVAPANSILKVNMARRTDGKRIWYEWFATILLETPDHELIVLNKSIIHNYKGEYHSMIL